MKRWVDCRSRVCWAGAGLSQECGLLPEHFPRPRHWHEFWLEPETWRSRYRAWRDLIRKAPLGEVHNWLARDPELKILTLNQDGLLQRAGCRQVLELHGSAWDLRCHLCGDRVDLRGGAAEPEVCARCQGPLRPDVVWTGEALPEERLALAQEWLGGCDGILCVGLSGLTLPTRDLLQLACRPGVLKWEVNPSETALSDCFEHHFRASAGQVLGELLAGV